MAANTQNLFLANGKPAPQIYNSSLDKYEVLKGANGASYSTIVDTNGNPITSNNRLPVDIGGATINATMGDIQSKTVDVTLQNAVSAIGNGTAFTVGAYKTLTIEIYGTSASRTIVFEGASSSGTYYAIQGVKLSDLSMATQTTGTGELWQFNVTGLFNFRTRISAISGGNVSVKARAVA